MSFVRLDNGEFPPLNQTNQKQKVLSSKSSSGSNNNKIQFDNWSNIVYYKNESESKNHEQIMLDKQKQQMQVKSSCSSETSNQSWAATGGGSSNFLRCRVGVQTFDFGDNIESILDNYNIGNFGDFLIIPIEPIRRTFYDDDLQPLSDLALPSDVWDSRIAISLGHIALDRFSKLSIDRFERLFKHALYLLSPVVIVHCPDSELSLLSIASIVNDYLTSKICGPIVLFKIQAEFYPDTNSVKHWLKAIKKPKKCENIENNQPEQIKHLEVDENREPKEIQRVQETDKAQENLDIHAKQLSSQMESHNIISKEPVSAIVDNSNINSNDNNVNSNDNNNSELTSQGNETGIEKPVVNITLEETIYEIEESKPLRPSQISWTIWNKIRSHLVPHKKLGICLELNEGFFIDKDEELNIWLGEPVRMIILHVDQFVRSFDDYYTIKLNNRCENFIEKIMLANSLNTSVVINGSNNTEELKEYIIYLDCFTNELMRKHQNGLLDWNDRLQCPLQPLSSNLDSGTYSVFESDLMKYTKYRDAMIEAINVLIADIKDRKVSNKKKFNIMVLGAGRGPLVDKFIEALEKINITSDIEKSKFKIFALDKNPNSINSLRYKQASKWISKNGLYETEVVEADMRNWRPGVKADIIITELLGSFSDNELSPECIDGTWKLATPRTISIPQEYSSYIAPICSYKLYTKLYSSQNIHKNVFDQIYVVRLTNFYNISEPQKLFTFEHHDLSKAPSTRCNERYQKLVFYSSIDTVCHGFAGYFTANLFGSTSISTVHGESKTIGMESWFPAFIPLESPIQMPKNTRLELHFWRKESNTSVWYEWVLTEPIRSRFYSPKGVGTAMSKFI